MRAARRKRGKGRKYGIQNAVFAYEDRHLRDQEPYRDAPHDDGVRRAGRQAHRDVDGLAPVSSLRRSPASTTITALRRSTSSPCRTTITSSPCASSRSASTVTGRSSLCSSITPAGRTSASWCIWSRSPTCAARCASPSPSSSTRSRPASAARWWRRGWSLPLPAPPSASRARSPAGMSGHSPTAR